MAVGFLATGGSAGAGDGHRGGGGHSAAVGEEGALFVWGHGEYGQLGTGDDEGLLAPTENPGVETMGSGAV